MHYDCPFAPFVEGHPGLVVQADLVAALLLDLLREHEPDARVSTWELRILRWLYDTEPCFCLVGRTKAPAELWAEDSQGRVAMEASQPWTANRHAFASTPDSVWRSATAALSGGASLGAR